MSEAQRDTGACEHCDGCGSVNADGNPVVAVPYPDCCPSTVPALVAACRRALKTHAPVFDGKCRICGRYGIGCDARAALALAYSL